MSYCSQEGSRELSPFPVTLCGVCFSADTAPLKFTVSLSDSPSENGAPNGMGLNSQLLGAHLHRTLY